MIKQLAILALTAFSTLTYAQITQVVSYAQWQQMVQAGALAGIQPPPYVVVRGCTAQQMEALRRYKTPCGY